MKLKKNDHIITAFAESANGPGWANQPIWVIVKDADGRIRQECIQPEDQTREMRTLYRLSQEAHALMLGAVRHAGQEGQRDERS